MLLCVYQTLNFSTVHEGIISIGKYKPSYTVNSNWLIYINQQRMLLPRQWLQSPCKTIRGNIQYTIINYRLYRAYQLWGEVLNYKVSNLEGHGGREEMQAAYVSEQGLSGCMDTVACPIVTDLLRRGMQPWGFCALTMHGLKNALYFLEVRKKIPKVGQSFLLPQRSHSSSEWVQLFQGGKGKTLSQG